MLLQASTHVLPQSFMLVLLCVYFSLYMLPQASIHMPQQEFVLAVAVMCFCLSLCQTRYTFLIHLKILVAHVLCLVNNMVKISGSLLLKLLILMKKSGTKPRSNLYVLIIIININILCRIMRLLIILKIRRIKIFCGDSNASLHIKGQLLHLALI